MQILFSLQFDDFKFDNRKKGLIWHWELIEPLLQFFEWTKVHKKW